MNELAHWALVTIEWMAGIFLFLLVVFVLVTLTMFIIDRTQTANALRATIR